MTNDTCRICKKEPFAKSIPVMEDKKDGKSYFHFDKNSEMHLCLTCYVGAEFLLHLALNREINMHQETNK